MSLEMAKVEVLREAQVFVSRFEDCDNLSAAQVEERVLAKYHQLAKELGLESKD